jgi:hypothetical protein
MNTSMRPFNLDVDLIRMKENINSWIIHEYHCAFIWAGLVSYRLMLNALGLGECYSCTETSHWNWKYQV